MILINKYSATKYCQDDISLIENYDKAIADTTHTWECHHRLELTLDDEFAHSSEELKRFGMYYDRPYFELIFLTKSEHNKLHNLNQSDETRKKRSETHKGENNPMYGKTGEKNPFYGKAHSAEAKRKLSEAKKGKHWKFVDGRRVWY